MYRLGDIDVICRENIAIFFIESRSNDSRLASRAYLYYNSPTTTLEIIRPIIFRCQIFRHKLFPGNLIIQSGWVSFTGKWRKTAVQVNFPKNLRAYAVIPTLIGYTSTSPSSFIKKSAPVLILRVPDRLIRQALLLQLLLQASLAALITRHRSRIAVGTV